MKVLSLCDGMSCGQIALNNLGIKVDEYYAAEIKDVAIKVTKYNYPDTHEIGNLKMVSYENGILHTEQGDYNVGDIDLVMFGSPCQSFSIANCIDRVGFANKDKSGLFYECLRILKEVNPKHFLMENVASMKDEDRDEISKWLGVEPILINSSSVAPALRKRYYWTDIPQFWDIQEVKADLQDALDNGYTNRKKSLCLLVSNSRPSTTPVKIYHRFKMGLLQAVFKSKEHYEACVKYYDEHYKGMNAKSIPDHETDVFDGIRILTQAELERCQTVPAGYTKCLTRNEAADVLGDGWTIKVIEHLLKGLKEE